MVELNFFFFDAWPLHLLFVYIVASICLWITSSNDYPILWMK